jgi:hypothetical protein
VAAAKHRNYDIEGRIPPEFTIDMLVQTWSPQFQSFWDPREWPPYNSPKYVADLAYKWNNQGSRKRLRHKMVMDEIPERTRHGRATPFLTDPKQYECGKCDRLGHNSCTCHWQISEVRLMVFLHYFILIEMFVVIMHTLTALVDRYYL